MSTDTFLDSGSVEPVYDLVRAMTCNILDLSKGADFCSNYWELHTSEFTHTSVLNLFQKEIQNTNDCVFDVVPSELYDIVYNNSAVYFGSALTANVLKHSILAFAVFLDNTRRSTNVVLEEPMTTPVSIEQEAVDIG